MSFGQTLRESREAKGLSQSELASKTNLLVQVVNGLENEDFRLIPAPIYGRGFVKLYCEATEIDPKPLQEEFMRLYKEAQERPPKPQSQPTPPKKRETAYPDGAGPREEPEQPTPSAATETETSGNASPDAFSLEAPETPIPTEAEKVTPVDTAPPRRDYGDLFGHSYSSEDEPKTSAAEKFRTTMSNVSSGVFSNVKHLPPNIGRIAVVGVAAIFVLIMIGWGINALYDATSRVAADIDAVAEENADTATEENSAAAKADEKQAGGDTEKKTAREETTPKEKTGTAAKAGKKAVKTSKPENLKSTGPAVPSLYIN